ncbi:MAG: ketopantoate reductase family protein [Stenotrophomonas maltophilia]
MKIAVMGAGSIGGYFGGMLAQGGHQVTLIARGAHRQAIEAHGLKIITDAGESMVRCATTDNPNSVGPVELVLLTVKTYHNAQAVPAMLPLIDRDTSVLCLQNGIDSYQAVAQAVAPVVRSKKVLPGAAYIEASLAGPGVVRQSGQVVRIVFGELDGSDSDRGQLILQVLEQSGIPAQFTQDIQQTLWTKFLFIATMAGVTTLSRETMAQLMPRPEWRQAIIDCMQEIEAVAVALGVNLAEDVVSSTMSYVEGSLEQMHASMHADVVAGRPLELEALNGAVVRAGRMAQVPTPVNNLIYAMVKPFKDGHSEQAR